MAARRAISVEKTGDQPFLNRRADAFVGREFTLEKPIVGGSGTVKIDDTIWRLSGSDIAAGSRVKVVRADAATLVVEAGLKFTPNPFGALLLLFYLANDTARPSVSR